MSSTALKISDQLSRTNLEFYQEKAADYINTHDFCALWVDCGLGKTASTLAAIADQLSCCMASKVLVIAPKKVAVDTWPDEIEKWSGLFDFPVTYSLMVGTPKQRQKAASVNADIYIINVENLAWLIKEYKSAWAWDWTVLDESSLFKSHSTKRFKALKSMLRDITRVTQLTGTPASNGLMNVWSQVYLLDRGERLGRTITDFRRRYFTENRRGDWTEYVIKPGAEQEIYDKLSDLVFRLDGDDYLKMDPIKNVYHNISLPSDAVDFYQSLVSDLIVEMSADTIVTAVNKAVLTNKLLQVANGAVYLENEDGERLDEYEIIHDEKLDRLEHIIEETGSPILVAYNFRHDLERLKSRFPHAVDVKEPGAVARWNAGKIELMLAHPASAGHGLNLQDGGHVMVWFGLNWSLEYYQQFNARLRRKGQKKPVLCHHLIAESTVDKTVLEALDGKNVTQEALLNALKDQAGV